MSTNGQLWQPPAWDDSVTAACAAFETPTIPLPLSGSTSAGGSVWFTDLSAADLMAAYQAPGAPVPVGSAVQRSSDTIVVVTGPFRTCAVFAEDTPVGSVYTITPGPSLVISGAGPDLDGTYFCHVAPSPFDPDPDGRSIFAAVQGRQHLWLVMVATSQEEGLPPRTGATFIPIPPGGDASSLPTDVTQIPGAIVGQATLGPADPSGLVSATITTASGGSITIAGRQTASASAIYRAVTIPRLRLQPNVVSPGDNVSADAYWFKGGEALTVTLDDPTWPAGGTRNASTGGWYQEMLTISPTTSPGQHAVAVIGQSSGVSLTTQLTVQSKPAVSGVDPATGPAMGGTVVTIAGTGFTGATDVSFNELQANSFQVLDDSHISAVTPADSGVADVVVTTPFGLSPIGPADRFTYVPPTPVVVQSMDPSSSLPAGGIEVKFTGSNLSAVTAVTFGDVAATFSIVDDTSLTAVAPAGAGMVYVTLTSAQGAMARAGNFLYIPSGAPVIAGIDPTVGPAAGGTKVTITGQNFSLTLSVSFGDQIAVAMVVLSDNQIAVMSPAGSGMVALKVLTNQGASDPNPSAIFTYQ